MNNIPIPFILIGVLFVAAFMFITVWRKSLTLGGAMTAAFMGIWVVAFVGIQWLVPLFFFFISGTLLGKLNTQNESVSDNKHGKGRDAWQVICNGLPYALLATFVEFAQVEILILMAVSVAIATADTWSSEIGIYFRSTTIDILRFKKQSPGVSGGISLPGTIGGLFGAILAAGVCIFLISDSIELFIIKEISIFCLIATGGFLGMLLDSVLGAAFQLKYKNPQTGELSDIASSQNTEEVGVSFFSNDVVNLVSNLVGTGLFALFLYCFFKL